MPARRQADHAETVFCPPPAVMLAFFIKKWLPGSAQPHPNCDAAKNSYKKRGDDRFFLSS
jgi:hypothetical protein